MLGGYPSGTITYLSKDATEYVLQAIKAGFRHIDTAQGTRFSPHWHRTLDPSVTAYKNEESVGAAVEASGLDQKDLYITTKYGGGDDIRTEFERSLKKVTLHDSCKPNLMVLS
jgi:2,5-diketo-D-gluconate reductase A